MKFLKFWLLKTLFVSVAVLCLGQIVNAQTDYENYTFLTFAGPDSAGPGSVDGVGNAARLSGPVGVARDTSGNLYIADSNNHEIRKVAPNGLVTTLAGLAGFPGTNDGAGAAARFNTPYGIAVDSAGNVYVADSNNHTIRKISPSGVVTTLAGLAGVNGAKDGTGSAARFFFPRGIAVDSNNNIFVADTSNDTIREITTNGVVTTFAGSAGFPGTNNATGKAATFDLPVGINFDANGNLYVADFQNNSIRKVTPGAVVSTLAGSGPQIQGSNDGTNGTAQFHGPFGVVAGPSGLFVTDSRNNTIRMVTYAGVVTTIVGSASASGSVDATGLAARLNNPGGITIDDQTNLYEADFVNNSIRKVSAALDVTTFVGLAAGSGTNDATGSAARFNSPGGSAFGPDGNLYVADQQNHTIRKITPQGDVSTFAGTPGVSGTNDGVGSVAMFNAPNDLAFDPGGNMYVADTQNHTIRMITTNAVVSTLAGFPSVSGTNDGVGTNAQFNLPEDLTVDAQTNIYVSDTFNQVIRKVTPDGTVTTIAGVMRTRGSTNGTGLAAEFDFPEGIVVDPDGNLFVVDNDSSTIREITPAGVVTTFAGSSGTTGSADGVGTNAQFNFPAGMAIDASRNLYVGDAGNVIIRKITPLGSVTTLGGVPNKFGNSDGTGSAASFNGPEGVAVDAQGNLYVSDTFNNTIRKGYPALPDVPMVDRIGAPAGVMRNFSISNQTTTSWSWSLIRHPSGSAAQIVGSNTANPTFTPDIDDIYVIQFQGSDNSGHTTIKRITLYADDTAPTITITNPAAGTIASNGVFTVAGITADDLGVSNVYVQLNGGSWSNATGTTNWALIENLVPGAQGISTNTIRAFSQDFAGNVSATNQFDLTYVRSDRLKVAVKGGGTLKPNLNGVFLQIGQTYSITVKAASGSTFSNWTANLGAGTNSQTITFIMQSNLSLTANCIDHSKPTVAVTFPKPAKFYSVSNLFIIGTAKDNDSITNISFQLNGGAWTNATGTSNWFTRVALNAGTNTLLVYAQDPSGNSSTTNRVTLNYLPTAIAGGNYAGLFFDTNNLTATNAGFFSAAVTPAAAFTAKLLLGSSMVSFSGQFSQDGAYANSFVAKGFDSPFTVQLQLDLSGAGTITGSVSNSGWSSPLVANQDIFSTANPPSQAFQRFSLVIPGGDDSSTQPGGNSTGTIILDGAGGVSFTGSLADGSPASQKTFISKHGLWPFYISSSSGQGVTLGWLTFSPGQKGTLTGQVYWERLPQANANLYQGGFNFTNGIPISASFYDWFVRVPTLILPNGGQVVLQQAGISPALTNYFTLSSQDNVSSTNKLKLTITLNSGAFKGTAVDPANNLSIPISGVILTNQNAGFGFFINSNQSGSVCITNAP
jgi:sugar lactone lactonase YvrE